MPDDLDQLSTKELHDRAIHRAERHLDVKFLWSLLETLPAVQASRGNTAEAESDIQAPRALLADALYNGDGELAEGLRPLFVDYLRKHADA